MPHKIGIAKVLSSLRAGEQCSLTFIRASGKRKGTKKTVPAAVEGYHYEAFKERQPREHLIALQKKGYKKHTMNGTIPIIDLNMDQQLTVLISHIIGFNGHIVIH